MKQGPSTFVVSLPSEWVKKNHIRKGDTVHAFEQGKVISFSPKPQSGHRTLTLNVSGTLPMTHRIVGALYKAGYDEMELTYSHAGEGEAIIEAAKVMTGHEVISHEKKTIVIKRIALEDTERFPTVYRKCFHILTDMARETLMAMEKNDRELMRSVILKDKTMATFADYTRRILLGNHAPEHAQELYHIIEQIEKIADQFKYVCKDYEMKERKMSPGLIALFKELVSFVELFQTLFYEFSLQKVKEFGEISEHLTGTIKKYSERYQKEDVMGLMYGMNITTLLFDLNGPVLSLKLAAGEYQKLP